MAFKISFEILYYTIISAMYFMLNHKLFLMIYNYKANHNDI